MKKESVICDACVLINLAHIGAFGLLGKLKRYQFKVAQAAADELRRSRQKEELETAIEKGWIQVASIDSPFEDDCYRGLRSIFGEGESASLALAGSRGWIIATDEGGALVAAAESRLGQGRLVSTGWILLQGIREGHISVEEADEFKRVLELNQFRMNFESFRQFI